MAIDPPYRLDPFRNIVNVHWGEEEETWVPEEGPPEDFTVLFYCEYDSTNEMIYSAWLRAFDWWPPPGSYVVSQQQTQSLPNWVGSGESIVAGKSASITLRSGASEIIFEFNLSDIYPQYSEQWSSGGKSYRYKWDFLGDPYKFEESLGSRGGQLAIAVPTRRTLEHTV